MEDVPHGIKPQGRKTVPVPVPVIVKKSLNPQGRKTVPVPVIVKIIINYQLSIINSQGRKTVIVNVNVIVKKILNWLK